MKVSDHNRLVQLDAYVRQAQQQQPKPGDPNTANRLPQAGSDKVELSDEAKQIQKAAQDLSKSSDVREDKVREIKMEVERGTYQVEGAQVASDMLKESLENDVILRKINTRA